MSGLSLNDFKNLLRDEVEKIAKDKQLNIDNLKDRSDCLNTWIASFYKNNYKSIELESNELSDASFTVSLDTSFSTATQLLL